MKYISNGKIKKLVFVLCVSLFAGLILFILLQERKKPSQKSTELVVTEPAPKNILFASKDGVEVSSSGNISVLLDEKEYTVLSDGSVWGMGQDGSFKQITDPVLINKVLTRALSASEEAFADSDAIKRNIELKDLSEEDIKLLAQSLGVSEDSLREIVQNVKNNASEKSNLLDAMGELDLRALSDSEVCELAEKLGVPGELLEDLIKKSKEDGKAVSVKDALKILTDDTMFRWMESGLKHRKLENITPEDVIKIMEKEEISAEEAFNIVADGGFGALFKRLGFSDEDKSAEDIETSVLSEDENSFYRYDYLEDNSEKTVNSGLESVMQDLSLLASLNEKNEGASGFGSDSNSDNSKQDASSSYRERINQASNVNGNSVIGFNGSENSNVVSYRVQNAQEEKRGFLTRFQTGNKVSVVEERSMKNMITEGTPIKAVLYTGINTDLPGMITAIVSENVYDSFTKTNLLIPKFSKLIATYDSSVSWGQSRIMVSWTKLIRPDGVIVDLNGFQGVDNAGHAGIEGKVNHHIPSLIASTAMASLISVSTGQFANSTENIYLSALFGGGASAVNSAANNLLNSAINRQNTITVEPGAKIVIMVNSNLELTTYRE